MATMAPIGRCCLLLRLLALLACPTISATAAKWEAPAGLSLFHNISVDWANVSARARAVPTVHMPSSYAFHRTDAFDGGPSGLPNPLHGPLYRRLKALNATQMRYMQAQDGDGLNDLRHYPEPYPPNATDRTTSWDMDGIDQYVEDFCASTHRGDCSGHVFFLGPLPPWMWHTSPTNSSVCTARDPRTCTGPLIDKTAKQAGEYYSRIVSWYNRGWLVDEFGTRHVSRRTRNFNITHWEVLNEPALYVHNLVDGPTGRLCRYSRGEPSFPCAIESCKC